MARRSYKFPAWIRGTEEIDYWVILDLEDTVDAIVFTVPSKKGYEFFEKAVFHRVIDEMSGTRFELVERRAATQKEISDYLSRVKNFP